jgi:hypothetical protein
MIGDLFSPLKTIFFSFAALSIHQAKSAFLQGPSYIPMHRKLVTPASGFL